MKKIPCLFERDFTDRNRPVITNRITPGCEWVLAGEGRATRKWDGTACMIRGGKLFARYDAKRGKIPPPDAIPCDPAPDPVTGHWPHWIPATRPEDRWIREAAGDPSQWEDGTYEAVGPKIGGNHEQVMVHFLARHGAAWKPNAPIDFEGLREYLRNSNIEGIVFHHNTDGRMAKIRRDDFGFDWPIKTERES